MIRRYAVLFKEFRLLEYVYGYGLFSVLFKGPEQSATELSCADFVSVVSRVRGCLML